MIASLHLKVAGGLLPLAACDRNSTRGTRNRMDSLVDSSGGNVSTDRKPMDSHVDSSPHLGPSGWPPPALQTPLPLEFKVVGVTGFEPTTSTSRTNVGREGKLVG